MTTHSDALVSSKHLIERARQLRPQIRAEADAAERLGHYTPELHDAFREAGFYDLLTPRRYGGLEVDLGTFARIMMEVGRGDPGTAWCLCLGQGHALTTAAHWPERAQQEVFATEHGYFRASHSLNPSGTAQRVDGGWLINAHSRYQSGIAYATHATVSVKVVDDSTAPSPGEGPSPTGGQDPAAVVQVLIPAGQFTVDSNWGADTVFGLRASGSNSIVVDRQFVPEYYAASFGPEPAVAAPGAVLHDNPIYSGLPAISFFQLELVVSAVGAARAALDVYAELAKTKVPLHRSPAGLRFEDPFYQRDFGAAKMKTDAAEAIVLHTADTITAWCREAVDGLRTFTGATDNTLAGMLVEAGELAGDAVDILFRSAGTSASMHGQPMQRYLRDISMYRTHRGAQYSPTAAHYGAVELSAAPEGAH